LRSSSAARWSWSATYACMLAIPPDGAGVLVPPTPSRLNALELSCEKGLWWLGSEKGLASAP
jgi:hypothetical protein